MKTSLTTYVVFDTETTGLKPENSAIIEIACCSFDQDLIDGKEYESGVMKIYGDKEINQKALDANGITREQIGNGRDPKLVAEEFCNYLKSLNKGKNKVVLCGQNSDKFDIPFVSDWLQHFNKDLESLVNTDFTIDTLWWGRIKYTELVNYKLGTLCSENGIELTNAHRAINDTRATRDLVKLFIRSLRSGSNSEKIEEAKRFRGTFEM